MDHLSMDGLVTLVTDYTYDEGFNEFIDNFIENMIDQVIAQKRIKPIQNGETAQGKSLTI